MKRKQVYILLGAALILAIAGTIFQMVRSAGWKGQSAGLEPFKQLPVNSIGKLVIKSSKGTLDLQKTNDIWTVSERNGYPADFSKIRDLIRSLWEFKVVRESEVGPSQFGRLRILTPGKGDESGVELDMSDASGKPIKTLIFGKAFGGETSGDDQEETPGNNGRFVYDPSEKDKVYLGQESFFTVDPSPENWIDKDFIKPDAIKEVTRDTSPTGDGWKVSRKDEKAAWELIDAKPGETLKTDAVAGLTNFAPSFTDVKPADTPDSETGLKQPLTVNVTTFDGFKYTFEIGGPAPQQSHFVRLKVSADLPAARTPDLKESADDKKKKDEEFSKQQEALKTRLTAEEKLQKWIFQVEDWGLETFLKVRKDLLNVPATPAPRPAGNVNAEPKPNLPVPVVPSPTPEVSPSEPVASPTPEVSATPETTPTSEPTSTPEATPTPETTATPEPTPTPEAEPSSSPSPK